MSLDDAFAEDVTPGEFFTEHLPELFEEWTDVFAEASDVELIVGIRMTGLDAGEWTLIFSDLDLEAEPGRETRPLLTLEGDGRFWSPMKPEIKKWLAAANKAREAGDIERPPDEKRLTNARLTRMERLQGHILLTLRDSPAGELTATVFLNSFDERGPSGLNVTMDYADFMKAINGKESFQQLAADKKIDVSGDMGLPMKLMSAVM